MLPFPLFSVALQISLLPIPNQRKQLYKWVLCIKWGLKKMRSEVNKYNIPEKLALKPKGPFEFQRPSLTYLFPAVSL